MKIALLTRSLNYGGAERQLVLLATGLRHRGHSVLVIAFYAGGPLERALRNAGVAVWPLNKRSRWDVLPFLFRLIKLIRSEKPDIIHGYLCIPNLLTVLLSLVLPRARIVWGVRASRVYLERYDWLTRLSYRLECLLSRFSDLIIVNSQAGFEYAASNGFPQKKMIVIPNGIDTVRFLPDRQARRRMREHWGVREKEKLVGLVARLDPMKDHETFLKAAALVLKEHGHTKFVCVGGGDDPYRRKLVEISQSLMKNSVIWAGQCDDMFGVYNALDLLVSSSISEGFPNAIGEAMACGVPCVVTDVGDSRLIVGSQGEIVPPGDARALNAAISKCLSKLNAKGDEQESLRQRIIDSFSITALEAKTESALLQLCRNN